MIKATELAESIVAVHSPPAILEGTLLSMMLRHRVATSEGKNGENALLSAPQVVKLSMSLNRGSGSRRAPRKSPID